MSQERLKTSKTHSSTSICRPDAPDECDLEQAIQIYNMMWKRGITPDGILFNSILDGCARKQMRTLTEKVLGDMEEAKVAPSNFTLSILVKLYGRLGDLDRAFKVVETYPAKYGFDLNATVYTCLMSSCMSNDDAERSPPVRHMLATEPLGDPGVVWLWIAYQTGLPVLFSASLMAANGSCWGQFPHPSSLT